MEHDVTGPRGPLGRQFAAFAVERFPFAWRAAVDAFVAAGGDEAESAPQIDAFRMFQITTQFQTQYGYPALTPEIKAQIFGRTAAKVFCVDPDARRCAANDSTFASVKRQWDAELGQRRWAFQRPLGPTTRREFFELARRAIAKKQPGA